jgi:pantoate--beta-alanine ligase
MIIIHQAADLQMQLDKSRRVQASIGFVPTMGALHQGHISLINESRKAAEVTVCSIFVNPTQFNDVADYNKYPSRIPLDVQLLEKAGTTILYLPDVNDIYRGGTAQLESYDLGYLETVLEGKFRPGHFQGVCQVMSRLLDHVNPSYLFMGKKDYQQCMVVQRLLHLKSLQTKFVGCETMREEDGLAMSSRNLRLDAGNRAKASHIYQSLLMAKNNIKRGDLRGLKRECRDYLAQHGFKVDYFDVATAGELKLLDDWDGVTPLVALVAAFLGDIRLIDNMEIASRAGFS